jgi:hypothetical protein
VPWLLFLVPVGAQEQKGSSEAKPISVANPALLLVHDPSVLTELSVTAQQRKTIRAMLDGIDESYFKLRDVGPEEGGDVLRSLTIRVMSRMKGILQAPQYERLEQLVLQGQGVDSLLLMAVAEKLRLSAEQRQQIEKIYRDARGAITELSKQVTDKNRAELEEQAKKLGTDGRDRIIALLSEEQKQKWDALKGKPFDFSKVRLSRIKAPEIGGGDAWINSDPLTLAKLRGQVVVVHFWTFG